MNADDKDSNNNVVNKVETSNDPNPADAVVDDEVSILIHLSDQSGTSVYFKIKPSTPLSRVFDAYCGKTGQTQKSLRFLYDGTQLSGSDTAKSVDIGDSDIIDVVLQQTGG